MKSRHGKQTRHEKTHKKFWSIQLSELRFSLKGCFASLFDDVANGVRWLSSFGDPVVCFFNVEFVVDAIFHWVVSANLLDVTAITAFAAVNGNDLIEWAIFCALAVKSESKHGKKCVGK